MNKYGSGKPSSSTQQGSPRNIHIAKVVAVGKISTDSKDPKVTKSNTRFNADEHAIRCVIVGSKYDGGGAFPDINNLPNCFPLMPKHINFVPKIGEFVIVMTTSEDDRFNDRFYIGPIASSLSKLEKDVTTTALANFTDGITTPTEEISKIPLARGVYENQQNVVIEGRNNTDIIQRDSEILLRSGKFVVNNPLRFNSTNPGFIQIKSNFKEVSNTSDKILNSFGLSGAESDTKVTVTNIVSDKINLLTYNGSPNFSNDGGMTNVNKDGVAEYINDAKLQEILDGAHPIPFGDVLIDYLRLMKNTLLNHVHNGNGNKATDRLPASTVYDLNKSAERLEAAMLSKNIRIN